MKILRVIAFSLCAASLPYFSVNAESPPAFTIHTIAGTGDTTYVGEGGPAIEAGIGHPTAVALDSQGRVYIADFNNRRVQRVNADGTIETVVGTGEFKSQKTDQPALKTNLAQAYGIAIDYNDNLYVLNRGHSKIYKVGTDGMARRIVGTGRRGFSGDSGPAVEAQISSSNHLVADRSGNLYIADTGNQRIRKVDANGIITTIAGTGEAGFSGDGGPATDAQLNAPSAIAIDNTGNLYIADFVNHRIRKIDAEGIITTIAGTGEPRFNGDGLPALESNIGEPCGVDVDKDGNVFIGDQVNGRMRMVAPDGIMYTVAGTERKGYTGDGGPATEARVRNPDIIACTPEGDVVFPDNGNNVIRVLKRVTK